MTNHAEKQLSIIRLAANLHHPHGDHCRDHGRIESLRKK
jgi:hypothetical protein